MQARTRSRSTRVLAVAAIGAMAAPGCGSTRTAPPTIGSTPSAGGDARPTRGNTLGMCDAIAAAVDAAPTFRSLAADPDRHDAAADQPASIAVEGATVTVLLREDSPDLTIAYPGGVPRFNELRKAFVACPVFDGADWELTHEDTADLELPEDRDHKIRFARPDALLAWMKVMSDGEVMIVIH